MEENTAFRVLGYASRADIRARIAIIADIDDVVVEEQGAMTRVAFPDGVLERAQAGTIADVVAGLVGADVAPGRQLVRQPGAAAHEISVTLIDDTKRPSFALPSAPEDVRGAVLDFLDATAA